MPDTKKIAQLVEADGTRRTYRMDDGSTEVWSGGTASWRHNNPGNLKFEFSGSADPTVHSGRTYEKALRSAQHAHSGVIALDPRGNAIFETAEAGRIAQLQVLKSRFGQRSVEAMVEGYSTKDYSGPTHHSAQLAMIYRTGDEHGIDLRHRRVDTLSPAELAVLAQGVARFEGFRVGQVNGRDASHAATLQPPDASRHLAPGRRPSHAIYDEASIHFLATPDRFEYGRPDAPRPGRDPSRLEQDQDGDGRLGVDCSAFVWRGLKNAGFNVPGNDASSFSTRTLFEGRTPTKYAHSHFDIISADEARRPHGTLEQGDLVLFSDGHSQHIAIFKNYDQQGRLHVIGSQSSTGPRELKIEPHGYWDGHTAHIVGALRAKPEFQTHAPLHAAAAVTHDVPHPIAAAVTHRVAHGHDSPSIAAGHAVHVPHAQHATHHADPAVRVDQHALNLLGARDAHGLPLVEDGIAGRHTHDAMKAFQRDHGLPATGRAGTETHHMLDAAHGLRITDTAHPDYALFERTLGLVQAAEAAKGIPSGPHSTNLAAAMLVQMREDGLTRVDRVEIGEPPRYARIVQTSPGGTRDNELMATVDVRAASTQSLHRSSDLLAQLPARDIASPDQAVRSQAAVLAR